MEKSSNNTSGTLVLFVNGKKIAVENADPEMSLLVYLRNELSLTGTKLGCGEGGCGVCTVMVSKMDRQEGKIIFQNSALDQNLTLLSHFAVNACLAPLCAMHGLAITTVEGIGSSKTKLHPIQERLAAAHGSQCGFCTPGFVMSMYALLRSNLQPTRHQLDEAFQGNLCRCTGYRPILDGLKTFTEEFQCSMGGQCCKTKMQSISVNEQVYDTSNGDRNGMVSGNLTNGLTNTAEFSNGNEDSRHSSKETLVKETSMPYDPSQEPIFPCELQLCDELDRESKVFIGPAVTWYRPGTLPDLFEILWQHPTAKLIRGNTDIGIEMKIKQREYPVLVSVANIPELVEVQRKNEGIYFGASCTLNQVERTLNDAVNDLPEAKTRIFAAILDMLKWFSGPQTRNVAAIGGNIMTASNKSDLNPLLMAARAKLHIATKGGESRIQTMDDTFFPSARKTNLRFGEILQGILIPYTNENEYFKGYRQARRRESDIAIVNAGMKVMMEKGSDIIKYLVISYGGVSPTTVLAKKTMMGLAGRHWDESLVDSACQLLDTDLALLYNVHGGMEAYKKALTFSFFFKFYLEVKYQLNKTLGTAMSGNRLECDISATYEPPIKASSGSQVLEMGFDNTPHPIGKPIPHQSGLKHTTGEAVYVDDMPKYRDELYMALVFSTKANAFILSVDPSVALGIPGVVTYIDHSDVPGENEMGCLKKDEEIFATTKVTCQGQVIGAIIAESALLARKAAHKVKVIYKEMKPIISIDSAIENNSYYDDHHETLTSGDITKTLSETTQFLSGEVRIGGQEHFYLETQATLAVPRSEDRDIEIFSSCQSPSQAQILVASALGIGAHRVTIRVKRIGGGFGGKETRYALVLLPAAVAAVKLGRPIRCMLDRDHDMIMTGTRHTFLSKYKVGFNMDGRIQGLDLDLYSNAGNSLDLSKAVMEKAMLQADNCYKLPSARIAGHLCKTNIPSCTAFRGFGGPQAMFTIESIVQQIAEHLDLEPHVVRELNFYNEGDHTPYRMPIEDTNFQKCWTDVIKQADYISRRKNAELFNREHRWRKRGIVAIPTNFGIGFTEVFFHQAVALVNIYTDGTVLVAHTGTEMGQGLHTKMLQVASRVLDIPMTKVFINETSTAMTPNMSPTAASMGSDLNGMAVMRACQKLSDRLAPYKKKSPNDTWEKWVETAYFNRVNLSATGFYKTPGLCPYDWRSKENDGPCKPFTYFTAGAAVTEVEIDCLTGDHVVLRTDIVMDIGQSLNPAIDIGQIEGGFLQGYGLFTLEEQRYSPDGHLYTRGPGKYKIPGLGDIPQEFNVTLRKGSSNPRAVYSSRAIGEPPLFLGVSAFFAIKEAIFAARKSSGISGHFRLDSPATAERIRLACVDQFTEQLWKSEAFL